MLALALLAKAALPMLAAAAAGVRGVAVAEVCTVYGVRAAALPDEPRRCRGGRFCAALA